MSNNIILLERSIDNMPRKTGKTDKSQSKKSSSKTNPATFDGENASFVQTGSPSAPDNNQSNSTENPPPPLVQATAQQSQPPPRTSLFHRFNHINITEGVIIALLGGLLIGAWNLYADVRVLGEQVTGLREDIVTSESHTKQYIDFLQSYLISLNDSFYRNNSPQPLSGYEPTEDFCGILNLSYSEIDAPTLEYTSFMSPDSHILRRQVDGQELTLGEVEGQKLLIPYTDEDNESLFYGQLSQNGKWDGHCIINTYKDEKLKLITDAQYADGILVNCNQVFPYHTNREGDVWAISTRTKFDGFSTGDTMYVIRNGDYFKSFELSQATVENILTAETFTQSVSSPSSIVGYYHGNVSNGLFNDDTGEAYLVKFFEGNSHNVRILYRGRMKNGNFADSYNEGAWLIGRESEASVYSYYTGPFENSSTNKNPKYWTDVSKEEIQEILKANLIFQDWNWDIPST